MPQIVVDYPEQLPPLQALHYAGIAHAMRHVGSPLYQVIDGASYVLTADEGHVRVAVNVEPRPKSQPSEGHGHVIPRPDGSKARCGGPGICPTCDLERARLSRQ